MFKTYNDFLNESEEFSIAKKMIENKQMSQALQDCIDGKFVHIRIMITPEAKSYVGVAINDGNSISEVYKTSDPRIALLCIIMKNIGKDDIDSVIDIIRFEDSYLNYAIFSGNKKMTPEQVAAKYNLAGGLTPAQLAPFVNTPINKGDSSN